MPQEKTNNCKAKIVGFTNPEDSACYKIQHNEIDN